jgi:hypothetical protein
MEFRHRQTDRALTLFAALVAACACNTGSARADGWWIDQLRQREAKFGDVSGKYESRPSLHPDYAAALAKTMKVPVKSVHDRYEGWAECEFALRFAGELKERRLDLWAYDATGKRLSHRILAFDGKDHYDIPYVPEPGERRVANVTLRKDVTSRFDNDCEVPILLGLSLPGCAAPLSACASTYHGQFIEALSEEGAKRVFLTFECPPKEGTAAERYTVTLDPGLGLAVRAVQYEKRFAPEKPWEAILRWTARELREDPGARVWYPIKEELVPAGLMVTWDIEFKEVRVNSHLSQGHFTPALEAGSNVYDEKKGRGYVHGGKLSKRIIGFIQQSADEARREVVDTLSQPTEIVPGSETGSLKWLFVAAGVAMIVVGSAWRWRQFRSSRP